MDAAKLILRKLDTSVEEMKIGDYHEIEVSGMMDLTIEKIGESRVSVAHYRTQHGDLMSDPEIVFKIEDDEWIPVRYTQHPGIHRHDETGIDAIKQFSKDWSQRLIEQGFLKAAGEDEVDNQ